MENDYVVELKESSAADMVSTKWAYTIIVSEASGAWAADMVKTSSAVWHRARAYAGMQIDCIKGNCWRNG